MNTFKIKIKATRGSFANKNFPTKEMIGQILTVSNYGKTKYIVIDGKYKGNTMWKHNAILFEDLFSLI